MAGRQGKSKSRARSPVGSGRRTDRSRSKRPVTVRPASRREVATFFRAVNRERMQAQTELLSADRLSMADEFFVAIADGKIVGAVCLVLDEGKCSELLTEYVLLEYQGRGIGTKLTKAAVQRLIAAGRSQVYIDVSSPEMDRTLARLPKTARSRLRLNRSYRKYGNVELPERPRGRDPPEERDRAP